MTFENVPQVPIQNTLSIRSYSLKKKGHCHRFHQLVLPVKGGISLEVDAFRGKVRPGECVVVKAGQTHYFAAEIDARFVVADLNVLPDNILQADAIVFSVTRPLLHFLSFIEEQLKYQVNKNIEKLMLETFLCLISEQSIMARYDQRIRNALDYIEMHLSSNIANDQLASVACLSPTQLKKLFKEQTGLTVIQYITKLRMDKAQALLLHTDYPIQIIAESVGYTDHAAFSRRFSKYYGMPPSKLSR